MPSLSWIQGGLQGFLALALGAGGAGDAAGFELV
jgi:hypothetical protein